YLAYTQVRTIFGEQEVHTPSEFLYDIPPHLTEKEFLVAKQNTNGFFGSMSDDDNDRIIEI
ncbi:MAG TPA: hypothetical protein VK145_01325, partial [Candidatus Nanoarchaeia archaeon]|nr:hypothetical protein [Candidatus Nanoarchaeia archaeon]